MWALDAADAEEAGSEAIEWQLSRGAAEGWVAVGNLWCNSNVRQGQDAIREVRVDRQHRVLSNPFELDDEGDTVLRDAVCDAFGALLAKQQHDAVFVRKQPRALASW